jgi:pimeloyl-ACP methyl ester carboxylesterase
MISRRGFTQGLAAAAATSLVGCSPERNATTTGASTSTNADLGRISQIEAGDLSVGYAEFGPQDGTPVVLLHGWPYDPHSYVDVGPMLGAAGHRVIVPFLRGYGPTRFLSRHTVRNAQQAAVAKDVTALMDALHIESAVLGGFDWGARTAAIVAALWPERCRALVAVSGYLITNLTANQKPLPPAAELGWWYQYYFATARGELGYRQNRHDFNKLIWRNASPAWQFDDATYDRTAVAFANPDHVDIVVHNYRWRLGLAPGESRFARLEAQLALGPTISVPTITIASDFDGPGKDGAAYRGKFTGRYEHRILDGVGHNVPQEAPEAFSRAVIDASGPGPASAPFSSFREVTPSFG